MKRCVTVARDGSSGQGNVYRVCYMNERRNFSSIEKHHRFTEQRTKKMRREEEDAHLTLLLVLYLKKRERERDAENILYVT